MDELQDVEWCNKDVTILSHITQCATGRIKGRTSRAAARGATYGGAKTLVE
jgi:hypothetical protein